MTTIKKIAAAAAVATLALAASDLSASAQSSLTNGPNGMQPNTLSSDQATGINGYAPSRAVYRRPVRTVRSAEASRRPLTVRRTVAAEAPVVVAPAPIGNTGPGTLITGPLGFASNVVSLPFRAINGIFPATGSVAQNPLVLIGAPLRAIGDIVQVPFRVIGAPFGGTTIATY
ncbi:hypothetical protein [Lichenibacterium dinghuense]|uniref:hypothetical protein n=1 Tax=Lichenibacterium dinghuense TaxID=2895977 RepID=UPI001F2135BC|nr:hypothetical protein [Lichenibacterium sp. 6Y81]